MRSPCDAACSLPWRMSDAGCNGYAADGGHTTPDACARRLVCETELSFPVRPSRSSAVHSLTVATDLFLSASRLDSRALLDTVPPACRTPFGVCAARATDVVEEAAEVEQLVEMPEWAARCAAVHL